MTLAVHLEDVLDGLVQAPVHHWDVALKKQLFFMIFLAQKYFAKPLHEKNQSMSMSWMFGTPPLLPPT